MAALAPVSVPASVPANVSSIGSPFSPYAPSGPLASPTSPSEQDLTTPKAESSLFGSQGRFARRAKGSVSSAHATPPCTDAVSPPRPPPKGPALSPNGLIQHIDQLSRRPTLLGTPPRSASLSSRTQTPTEIAPWNFSNDVGASLEPLVTPAHAPSMQQTPTDSRARALPPPTPTSSTKNGGSPATKEKKSRGFMSLLKRKTSKSELRTGTSSHLDSCPDEVQLRLLARATLRRAYRLLRSARCPPNSRRGETRRICSQRTCRPRTPRS